MVSKQGVAVAENDALDSEILSYLLCLQKTRGVETLLVGSDPNTGEGILVHILVAGLDPGAAKDKRVAKVRALADKLEDDLRITLQIGLVKSSNGSTAERELGKRGVSYSSYPLGHCSSSYNRLCRTSSKGGVFTFLALCTIQFVWDQMKKIEVRRRR